MEFITMPQANVRFGPPAGMTEEECKTIDAYTGKGPQGPYTVVCVMPSEKEKALIAQGMPIFIQHLGEGFAPMSVYMVDPHTNTIIP